MIAAFVAACAQTSAPAQSADAGPDASTGRSFDPRGYSTTCETKSDCMLAPIIQDCRTCCGETAVNAADVRADLDAVTQACTGEGRACSMSCERVHAECVEQQCIACGEQTCKSGVLVHTSMTAAGTYLFEGTIDDVSSACTVELPSGLQGPRTIRCAPGLELLNEVSPEPTTWSVGFFFATTTAKEVTFRATRDGELIGEKTFAPAYAAEPGPNGPQCAPTECLVAHATFP
jgi:hypothetical protein